MKQFIYDIISDKRSIPFNSTGTGTVVTHGIAVVGTGTLFTTEMRVGSYLVDLANDEVRRVYRVDSDTLAFLDIAFTVDLSSVAPEIIAAHQMKVKLISLDTEDSCFVDGVAFTGVMTIPRTGNDRSSRSDLIDPIIVDASGGSMKVEILNF
ncbi:MAG: hypothetical protein V4549_07435 [Bacteroidota bacterium]